MSVKGNCAAGFTIRPATLADAPAVADIHVTAWQSAYRGILPDKYLDDMSMNIEERRQRWRVNIGSPEQDHATAVASDSGGNVLGWVSFGPPRDEDMGPQVGEVWAIYVRPDDWRSGAGTALMTYAVDRMTVKGLAKAVLWVFEENRRARGFYEYHGWRHDGSSAIFERAGTQAIEFRYYIDLTRTEPSPQPSGARPAAG